MDLSKHLKDVMIHVSHVNAHQKVTPVEEDHRMTLSVESESLSPAVPTVAQWAHEQGPRWQRWGYSWA